MTKSTFQVADMHHPHLHLRGIIAHVIIHPGRHPRHHPHQDCHHAGRSLVDDDDNDDNAQGKREQSSPL